MRVDLSLRPTRMRDLFVGKLQCEVRCKPFPHNSILQIHWSRNGVHPNQKPRSLDGLDRRTASSHKQLILLGPSTVVSHCNILAAMLFYSIRFHDKSPCILRVLVIHYSENADNGCQLLIGDVGSLHYSLHITHRSLCSQNCCHVFIHDYNCCVHTDQILTFLSHEDLASYTVRK